MTKNKKIIIGNWKMHFTVNEASLYLNKLSDIVQTHRSLDVVLAPPLFSLQSLSLQVNRRQFKLAAQNFYWRDFGAFTGEVAVAQLKGIVDYALVGHSERRLLFNETDKDIRYKVQAALRSGIKPILCVGETMVDRVNNETRDVLNDQLMVGLANVISEEVKDCVIAYEPIWAAGTGEAVRLKDVEMAVKIIRQQLEYLFGKKVAEAVRVVYGGNIRADNARVFLQAKQLDGLMIGGASLNAYEFSEIIEVAYELSKGEVK